MRCSHQHKIACMGEAEKSGTAIRFNVKQVERSRRFQRSQTERFFWCDPWLKMNLHCVYQRCTSVLISRKASVLFNKKNFPFYPFHRKLAAETVESSYPNHSQHR